MFHLGGEEVLGRDEVRDALERLSHGTRGYFVADDHLDYCVEMVVEDEISVR